ncbi:hypothetical protein ACFY7H_33745 [Streptomyces sp. NPDC012794]|uniref:hypothetical protein n=1 Tax=Streptomyces sp. NPDC012794 TaxID=3364850 RepID=UPI0036BFC0A0
MAVTAAEEAYKEAAVRQAEAIRQAEESAQRLREAAAETDAVAAQAAAHLARL